MARILVSMMAVLFAAATLAAAEFRDDGSIISGAKIVSLNKNGLILCSNNLGDRFEIHLSMDEKKQWFTGATLENKSLTVDSAAKKAVFRGERRIEGKDQPLVIEYSLSLSPEGQARIEARWDWPEPVNTVLGYAFVNWFIPRTLIGKALVLNQNRVALDAPDAEGGRLAASTRIVEAVIFPDEPARRLAIHLGDNGELRVTDQRGKDKPAEGNLELNFTPGDNRIVFDLDLGVSAVGETGETYTGVDFWSADRLRMPRYGLCRNLVQNPGFEDGRRFWQYGPWGDVKETAGDAHYQIVEEGAFERRRCLKMVGEKGQTTVSVSTFAIPIEAGAEYTLSFHARADRPGMSFGVANITAEWPVFPSGKDPLPPLTTEWKRYSMTFTAPNGLIAIGFQSYSPKEDGTVWLDAVQFEKGPMTEYVAKPLSAQLVTARPGNLFAPGEQVEARLEVRGAPEAAGEIKLECRDFRDAMVHAETVPFTLDAAGLATTPLPWLEGLARGLYVLKTEIAGPNGFADREFDRLAIMPNLDGQNANQQLFCVLGNPRNADWKRVAAFYNWVGIGSEINFDPPGHTYLKVLDAFGIFNFTSIFDSGGRSGPYDLYQIPLPKPTEDVLKVFEENAFAKATAYPEITVWKTFNEPNCGSMFWRQKTNPMEDLVALVGAACKGIRRANPKAKILTPDPCDMSPRSGIQFIDEFLAAGGCAEGLCDTVAIHPYRPRPEEPNLDAEINLLLAVLAKHDFQGEVWFTEGIYHQNYVLPAYRLDAHRGCSSDHFRCGDFSYDLGWGEKICAAYTMRSWLAALKHSDRVKLSVDWGFKDNSFLDVDLTPTASAFAPNTLGDLLGSASFKTEVNLGEDLQCWIFEDGEKRPVAALWYSAMAADNGSTAGPMADFAAMPEDTEVFDMLGRGAPIQDAKPQRIDSFPLFLRGTPDSLAAFTENLAGIEIVDSKASPLYVYARAISATEIEVVARNILSRPLNGTMTVNVADQHVAEGPLALKPKEEWKTTVPCGLTPANLMEVDLAARFAPAGDGKPPVDFPLQVSIIPVRKVAAPLVIDGDLADWPAESGFAIPSRLHDHEAYGKDKEKYPETPKWLGENDLSARMRMAWDAEFLYVAIEVKDDVINPAAKDAKAMAYTGDGFQIYVDGFADARLRTTLGHDYNDQNLMVWWGGTEEPQAWRDLAPDQQFAFLKTGPVPELKTVFKPVPGGYVCEMAFPARQVQPLVLKDGAVFGFALIVNENDRDYRKRCLTILPTGVEPLGRPDLFPFAVLEK